MPKDASKNIDRYKIRGGDINEFEFHKSQEEFSATKSTKGTKKPTDMKKGATAKKLAARKAAKK